MLTLFKFTKQTGSEFKSQRTERGTLYSLFTHTSMAIQEQTTPIVGRRCIDGDTP